MLRRFGEVDADPTPGRIDRGVVVPYCEPVNTPGGTASSSHHRERQRDHGEEQAPHPQRGNPTMTATTTPTATAMTTARQPTELETHVPEVERHRDVVAGAQHHESSARRARRTRTGRARAGRPNRRACDIDSAIIAKITISVQRK